MYVIYLLCNKYIFYKYTHVEILRTTQQYTFKRSYKSVRPEFKTYLKHIRVVCVYVFCLWLDIDS